MDNPARRLHLILSRALQNANSNHKVQDMWAKTLNVPADDRALLLRRLGVVVALSGKIVEELRRRDDLDPELFQKWRPQVEAVLTALNFQQSSDWVKNSLDNASMVSLEYCAHALKQSTKELKTEELAELLSEIEDVVIELQETKLDERVKEYILERLREIRAAIENYEYGDSVSLTRTTEACVGSYVTNQDVYAKAKGADRGMLVKFGGIVRKTMLLLNIVGNVMELPETIAEYLPSEEETVEESVGPTMSGNGSDENDG